MADMVSLQHFFYMTSWFRLNEMVGAKMIHIINEKIELSDAIWFAINHCCKEVSKKDIDPCFTLVLELDDTVRSQGYIRRCFEDKVTLFCSDEAGFMYGILDLEKEICQDTTLNDIGDREVSPYLTNRGIKFNIPLDARTPSYSDASDSAVENIVHMWEYDFWTEFLDRMALDKYNVLSLWNLSPFPSLVWIPEYPRIALEDVKRAKLPAKADLSGWGMYSEDMEESLVTVKKLTIGEKIAFWQSVMEYAKNRCIKIFLFTWNLFIYGTEGNPYGITCDQSNPVTKDYIYSGTKALMDTYPLLAGIGVTSGEHMRRDEGDIPFLADSYGRGVKDYLKEHPEREFEFIHRMQYTRYDSILEEFRDFPCPFSISFKYSQAHMYSSTKPSFINSFLQEKASDLKIWLTVRNDDYYMYRWGDPEYAREYLKSMPSSIMNGYYMGADGYTWGRDYMDLRDSTHPMFIAKMWYMFSIWGQLSYNLNLPKEYFMEVLTNRFGKAASKLQEAWSNASAIFSEFNQVHWHDYDFQWYPEGCCMYNFETDKLTFAEINEFITCPAMPGCDYYSVAEYTETYLRGDPLEKISPIEAAASIRNHAEQALIFVKQILESDLEQIGQELTCTLSDIEALGFLGRYYSDKLEAAVKLSLFRRTGNRKLQEEAVNLLKKASDNWIIYSAKSKKMYRPQLLTRLCGIVDVQRFDTLTKLDILTALED